MRILKQNTLFFIIILMGSGCSSVIEKRKQGFPYPLNMIQKLVQEKPSSEHVLKTLGPPHFKGYQAPHKWYYVFQKSKFLTFKGWYPEPTQGYLFEFSTQGELIKAWTFYAPSLWQHTNHSREKLPQYLKNYEPKGIDRFIQRLSYSRQPMIFEVMPFL